MILLTSDMIRRMYILTIKEVKHDNRRQEALDAGAVGG